MSQQGAQSDAASLPVIHIACAADENYLPYCAAMLHSAIESCRPARLEVHFLHPENLPAPGLQRLRALVEGAGSRFSPSVVTEEAVRDLPVTPFFPNIIWFRLLLPAMRPELERVLYLDSDTLVLESLLPLWQTDLDRYRVAAVKNLIEPKLATRHHAFEIPPEQPYFNSGVLLMNLAAMRRDGSVEAARAHAQRYRGQSIWPDQDSLNHALGPRCLMLHPRWNCQNSFFYWPQAREAFGEQRLAEATQAPAVLHFEGPAETKPWHYLNDHPFRERYWRHLRATTFPVSPSGKTLKNVLRGYLPGWFYPDSTTLKEVLRRYLPESAWQLLRRVRGLARRR